jgi:hypothetical protein
VNVHDDLGNELEAVVGHSTFTNGEVIEVVEGKKSGL